MPGPENGETLKRALIVVSIMSALMVAFLAVGSAHRDRCLKAGNVGCTILPWSGHPGNGWSFSDNTPVIP